MEISKHISNNFYYDLLHNIVSNGGDISYFNYGIDTWVSTGCVSSRFYKSRFPFNLDAAVRSTALKKAITNAMCNADDQVLAVRSLSHTLSRGITVQLLKAGEGRVSVNKKYLEYFKGCAPYINPYAPELPIVMKNKRGVVVGIILPLQVSDGFWENLI